MADIERVVYESLRRCGVADLERLTQAVTGGIRREFRGWVYVDRGYNCRNAEIRASLSSGEPVQRVAARHGLTPARVRQIGGLG